MLTRQDSKMAQGLGILGMLCLHLFCQTGELPYAPIIWIGKLPLIYYIGLFGDLCVPVFCFSSGYAQRLLYVKKPQDFLKNSGTRILRFITHFWIVVCLFTVVGMVIGHAAIPGSFSKFAGNMLLFNLSYNGAWWFVVTYVLLIFMTIPFDKLQSRFSPILVLLGSGVIYFIAYIFRFVFVFDIPNKVLSWVWNQLMLLGTSQFSYIVGMLFHKHRIMDYLRAWYKKHPICCKIVILLLPIAMFFLHCAEPSLIIAPITGLTTLVCFHLWEKPNAIKIFFEFLGKHSTNLWLIHMFFYMSMFPNLIFVFRLPLASLLILLVACIGTSYIIEGIECAIKMLISQLEKLQINKKLF